MINELEKLATDATQTYWFAHPVEFGAFWAKVISADGEHIADVNEHNAEYVAAANPCAILKLIEVVKAASEIRECGSGLGFIRLNKALEQLTDE